MLGNFYGDDKIPVSMADIRKGNKKVSARWACQKMVEVADHGFGMTIEWDVVDGKTLTRTLASQYLYVFSKFDKAFRPIK